MTTLKILHINTEKTWRGGERQTFLLAQALQRQGHAVWVACRPKSPLARHCEKSGLPVIGCSPLFEYDPLAAFALRRCAKRLGIQIVHAHSAHAVSLGALVCRGTKMPLVATRRVDFPLKGLAWKYKQVNALVAISQKIKDVLRDGGIDGSVIEIIPSGIDPSDYPSTDDRNSLRAKHGFSGGDVLIVNAAALVPHKDQRTLLLAAQKVLAARPATRFLILGDGVLRKELEDLARDLQIAAQVAFLGHRPDVLDYIAMADAFVMSSKEEGLGTSILDALSLGIPTVATRAGGIPEIFGRADHPALVPPQNAAALAEGILQLLDDPEARQERVREGQERAKLFSAQAMAARYDNLYQRLVKK